MGAEGQEFLDWVDNGTDVFRSLRVNAASRNPAKWKHVGTNKYVWREGKPAEKEYDFSPFFGPDSEFGPEVDRLEGYMFALYEHRGGTGAFEPYPNPPEDEDE